MKLTLKEKGMLFGFPLIFSIFLLFIANIRDVYVLETKLTLFESPTGEIQRGALEGVNRGVRKLIRLSHRSQRTSSIQSFQETISMVESRQFIGEFIRQKALKPMIFPKRWDNSTQTWKKKNRWEIWGMVNFFRGSSDERTSSTLRAESRAEPSDWRATKVFKEAFSIAQEKNTGIIVMRLQWRDPDAGADTLNSLVEYANAYISTRERNRIEDNIRAMEAKLEQEVMPVLKTFLFEHIESMKSTLITQNVQIAPTFDVIDKAYVPQKPIFRIPKVLMLVGLVFGFLCSLVFLVIQRIKNDTSKLKSGEIVSAAT